MLIKLVGGGLSVGSVSAHAPDRFTLGNPGCVALAETGVMEGTNISCCRSFTHGWPIVVSRGKCFCADETGLRSSEEADYDRKVVVAKLVGTARTVAL
ncbi:hypothetical protein BCR43DRAFT_488763 [Syncephalastrum racemosum]|uniref:Uncharacterized protein n=1 Tax=Syncephalastrum racemosum TaxID=13706 RepID=A0A1X2HKK0_SYNRA|nr:hypothetical protein BCR43DRAFT_488763 [Syncephalastrum racemosum]